MLDHDHNELLVTVDCRGMPMKHHEALHQPQWLAGALLMVSIGLPCRLKHRMPMCRPGANLVEFMITGRSFSARITLADLDSFVFQGHVNRFAQFGGLIAGLEVPPVSPKPQQKSP